jgi:hypothetical protein
MAAKVLTTGSTVKCFHGFDVTFVSQATLRVGGNQVVRAIDLPSTTIACTAQQKCLTIDAHQASTTLSDGGSPVVLVTGLKTNIGLCTGINAAHDLLQAE